MSSNTQEIRLKDHNPDIEGVSFVINADGYFEFVNPCRVPVEMLEEAIKTHKKKKPKKGEVTVVGFFAIPFQVKLK